MRKIILLILTLMLLIVQPLYAEQENQTEEDIERTFEWLDRTSGISNMSISSMFQDKFGFIWFGTQGGLNRYDGNEVITFRNDPFDESSLQNNLIQTLYYDQDSHSIWIGTYQGLSHFNIDLEIFKNYTVESIGLSDTVVTSIDKDESGKLFIGTLNGLNIFDPVSEVNQVIEVPGNTVRDTVFTHNKRTFIATYEGLYYFENNRLIKYDYDLPSNYIMTMAEYDNGVLTLGLWDGGVVILDLEQNISRNIRFEDDRVYCMTRSEDGTLWVGTWGGGLFTMSKSGEIDNYKGIKSVNDISHPVVYSLLEDDSNIMWIGTNGGGVSSWNPRKKDFVAFRHEPEIESSISQGKVNVISEIGDKFYFGLYSNGLNVYDKSNKTIKKFSSTDDDTSLHNDTVNAIISYDNKILLATNKGLTYYNEGQDNFTKWPLIDQEFIAYSLKLFDDTLWIGTYGNGVFKYEDNKLSQFTSENSGLTNDIIYDIFEDSNKNIWFGTNDGLSVLENGHTEIKDFRTDYNSMYLPSNKYQVIYEDSKHHLWFGTSGGGITHYDVDEKHFTNYTEMNGLTSNDVLSILEDENNNFWIATNDGVSLINMTTTEILNYTPDDGIGGWEFSRGYLKSKSGQLLFGGVHGITEIPSNLNPIESKAPRVYISNISTIDKDLKPSLKIYNDKSIKIPANESYIAFDVVAIEFDAPSKVTFSYKLEGHDREWIHLGNNKRISYSNLDPGYYILKVQVSSAANMLSTIEQIEITILTPWYRSLPMYFLYVLTIFFIIHTFIRLRQSKVIRVKNDELSDLNIKLEEANTSLEKLSILDPLTGVYNRRYFKQELEDKLSLARRGNTSLALLMVDLDDFKHINDTYGHITGDHLLVDLCQKIQAVLFRKTDFISRYGGDEFSIVLYDTDKEGALKIARDIISISRSNFKVADDEVKMPLSIGLVALVPNQDDHLESVLNEADRMLYKAKNSGKNKICY